MNIVFLPMQDDVHFPYVYPTTLVKNDVETSQVRHFELLPVLS